MAREGDPTPELTGSQSPLLIVPGGLPEMDGKSEPEGLSYRGQHLVTGWVFFGEHIRSLGQLTRGTGVLLPWLAGPLPVQCGGYHTLVFRKWKIQGDADRAR